MTSKPLSDRVKLVPTTEVDMKVAEILGWVRHEDPSGLDRHRWVRQLPGQLKEWCYSCPRYATSDTFIRELMEYLLRFRISFTIAPCLYDDPDSQDLPRIEHVSTVFKFEDMSLGGNRFVTYSPRPLSEALSRMVLDHFLRVMESSGE